MTVKSPLLFGLLKVKGQTPLTFTLLLLWLLPHLLWILEKGKEKKGRGQAP